MDNDRLKNIRNLNQILLLNKLGHNKNRYSNDIIHYQKMVKFQHPDIWTVIYQQSFPIRIVYKDLNQRRYIYQFYVNKNHKMERILFMFEKFLICQKIALVNCFGLDIANIIFKYLPNFIIPNNNLNLPLIKNP